MESRVRRAERKFATDRDLRELEPQDVIVFPTYAPNRAEYGSLSSLMLLGHLEELQLDPKLVFADLGSGLGAACFAAATYFNQVHGLEYDPRLVMEAERLREGLGFNNVVFHQGDFLKADLSKYGVLYLFHPFSENFVPLMAERMDHIPSGTYVISQVFNHARPSIFTERLFERIHPLEIGEDEVGDDLVSQLITFRRR
jgi:predicted RNA methylase